MSSPARTMPQRMTVARSIEPNTSRSNTKPIADDRERGQHHVRVQELLGVENDPAQAPVGGGEHLGAHDRDPAAGTPGAAR
jgi:hypothetical protein